eukprot:scaffold239988_cov26-Tisochrysis_lutea.AAC.2
MSIAARRCRGIILAQQQLPSSLRVTEKLERPGIPTPLKPTSIGPLCAPVDDKCTLNGRCRSRCSCAWSRRGPLMYHWKTPSPCLSIQHMHVIHHLWAKYVGNHHHLGKCRCTPRAHRDEGQKVEHRSPTECACMGKQRMDKRAGYRHLTIFSCAAEDEHFRARGCGRMKPA